MDLPHSRASAFLRRNRTTHSWYGDWSTAGCIMSKSCPSPQTLEQHMRNARAAMSVSSSFYQPRTGQSRSSASSKANSPPPAGISKNLVMNAGGGTAEKVRPQYARTYSSPGRHAAPPDASGGVKIVGSSSSGGAFRSKSVPDGEARKPHSLPFRAAGFGGGGAGYRGSNTEPPSSSASSPGPTTTVKIPGGAAAEVGGSLTDRPPSVSYSYDGGFFVTANNAHKDFFVIDPEWVSEEGVVVEDHGEGNGKKNSAAPAATKAGKTALTRGKNPKATPSTSSKKNFKRSKSAPPPNHRVGQNPITWQETFE